MDGYKTLLVAMVGATVSLLTAFGVGISEEQQDAIQNFLLAAWPIAMVVMRVVTKGPVKLPGKEQA